jgi:hypothetical protein
MAVPIVREMMGEERGEVNAGVAEKVCGNCSYLSPPPPFPPLYGKFVAARNKKERIRN